MRRFWRNSEANTQKGRRNPLEKTWGHDKVDPPNADNIMLAVDSFKPDTASGISGWTVPFLCLACRSPRVVEIIPRIAHRRNRSQYGARQIDASSPSTHAPTEAVQRNPSHCRQ